MKDIAIIASVLPERFELLSRSMVTWMNSIRSSGLDCGIYLYIEGAPINDVMKYIPHDVPFSIAGGEERSGSHIFGYNHWKHIDAKVYLFTHPDILYPKDTIRTAFDNATDDTYVAFKCFWLPKEVTARINEYDWRNPETLEQEQLIYDLDDNAHGSPYENVNIRNITCWESTTTFCYNDYTAAKIFPFPDLNRQGYDDPLHAGLRMRLGIKNHTVMNPILMHQHHVKSWTGTPEEAVEDAQRELTKRFGG